MLTPEQLLAPRLIVLQPYPFSPYKVGDLVTPDKSGAFVFAKTPIFDHFDENVKETNHYIDYESALCKYPNLFRLLAWHEFRKSEDMPEYVKIADTNEIVKVKEHISEVGITIKGLVGDWKVLYKYCTPATESDFNNYQNQAKC